MAFAVRRLLPRWRQGGHRLTLATAAVAMVGALLGAMRTSALCSQIPFLALHPLVAAGSTAGAVGSLLLLGPPPAYDPGHGTSEFRAAGPREDLRSAAGSGDRAG